MSKRARHQTFADIVREVEQAPAEPVEDRTGVVDADGTRWHPTARISPARALLLAAEGAAAAWDPCGCGGHCGFDWFGPDEVARLVSSGTPTVRWSKRHRGYLSEWASSDGRVLVLAEREVRWGDLVDG